MIQILFRDTKIPFAVQVFAPNIVYKNQLIVCLRVNEKCDIEELGKKAHKEDVPTRIRKNKFWFAFAFLLKRNIFIYTTI